MRLDRMASLAIVFLAACNAPTNVPEPEAAPRAPQVGAPQGAGTDNTAGLFFDDGRDSELLTAKLRYKRPDEETSRLIERRLADGDARFDQASGDFRFGAAVAAFGMLLTDSPHRGDASHDTVLEIARESLGEDEGGWRAGFVERVERARSLGR